MSDDEFFDDVFPISPNERGQSFGMNPVCYVRMAKMSLRCREFGGIEPTTIGRLPSGYGCRLTLFGKETMYTLVVDASTSPSKVTLFHLPMESLEPPPGSQCVLGYDEPKTWHNLCDAMVTVEIEDDNVALFEWTQISSHLRASNDWDWMT